MHLVVLVVALGLPAVLVVGVVLLISAGVRPPDGAAATVVAARRHETRTALAAGVSGVCAALALSTPWAASWFPSGVLVALAPFVAAAVLAVARTVGEARWPRPTGEVREAPLARRGVPDQGGWRLSVLAGTVLLLAVALVTCGLGAAPDGRSVERTVALADGGAVVRSAGPFPGWELGGPALVALAIAVVATLLALRAVTRRPPIGLLTAEHDDAIRRTSAARLLAGAQVWVGLGAVGHLTFAGSALLRVGWDALGTACLGLALAVLLGSAGVAASALPARRAEGAVAPRAAA